MEDLFYGLSGLLAIGGLLILFFLVIFIAVYVVTSIGYSRLLRAAGYPNPWMAWIPYACYWALGSVACEDEDNVDMFGKPVPSIVLKLWWVATIVLNFVPYVGYYLALALQIICLGEVFIRLYMNHTAVEPSKCKLLGYGSGFIPLIAACHFLKLK